MDDLINQLNNTSVSLDFVKSQRGGNLLIDEDNYEYKIDYRCKTSSKISWRCNEPNCTARVYTNGMVKPIHKVINVNKEQVDSKPKSIIQQNQLSMSDELAVAMPSYNALRQVIQRNRVDPYSEYEIPNNFNFEFSIPNPRFTHTNKGESFLFHDSGADDSKRIFIFCTANNLTLLNTYRNWYVDATFDSAPHMFYQLFTIHIIKNNKNLPMVYALLPNKEEETYCKVLNEIKKHIGEGTQPLTVTSDYELAIMNAVEKTFRSTEIFGCFFHFKQSIQRNIADKGLKSIYNDKDSEIRIKCKMLSALAYLPLEDILDGFLELQSQTPSAMNQLITYFEKTYIGCKKPGRGVGRKPPRFSHETWNVYDRCVKGLPRANGHVEGWHRGIQTSIDSHPHFYKLIDYLIKEQANTEVNLAKLNSGSQNKRKAVYVKYIYVISIFR